MGGFSIIVFEHVPPYVALRCCISCLDFPCGIYYILRWYLRVEVLFGERQHRNGMSRHPYSAICCDTCRTFGFRRKDVA